MEQIVGASLKKQEADIPIEQAFAGVKYVGIYFGAHWAPPCRLFTGQLKSFYEQANASSKEFEIVFVSIDGSMEAFKRNFADMPWLAINFDDEAQVNNIKQRYGVNGIPCLVIVDPTTQALITYDGRKDIVKDPSSCMAAWEAAKASAAQQ